MSVARLALRGVLISWMGQVVQIVSAFLITPILINNLGLESFGVWQLIMDVIGYTALVDLGVGSSTVKHLAEFESRGDQQTYVNCIAAARRANRFQSMVVVTAVVLLALGFPYFTPLEEVSAATVRWTALFTGLRVAVGMLGMTSRCILRSKNRFDLANSLDLSFGLLGSLGMLVLALFGWGLVGMGFLTFVLSVLGQLVAFVVANRQVEIPQGITAVDDPQLRRRMFSYGAFTVLSGVASRVTNYAGNVIIGLMLGPTMLAFYAPASSLCARVQAIGGGMVQFLLPTFARSQARHDLSAMRRMSILSVRVMLCVAIFTAIVFIVFGRECLDVWLDIPIMTERAYPILVLLSLALSIRLPSAAITATLAGLGMVQLLANRAILEAVVTVLLQLVLARLYGLPGVACGVLISQFFVVAVLQPRYIANAVQIPVSTFVWSCLWRPVLSSVVAVLVAVALLRNWPLGTFSRDAADWLIDHGFRQGIARRGSAAVELAIRVGIVGVTMAVPAIYLCLDRDVRQALVPRLLRRKAEPAPLPKPPAEPAPPAPATGVPPPELPRAD